MNERLVSVIIPTYNRAHTLQRTINSVFHQTYRNYEIIVVDDGSIDNTKEIVKIYGNGIRLITQKNLGPSSARNAGIKVSRGEYIAFLDSDDVWSPLKLEKQIEVLLKAPKSVACCLCNTKFTGEKYGGKTAFQVAKINMKYENSLWLNVTEVLITRFVLFNQAVLIKRDILISNGVFDERLKIMEDYELALRLSKRGPWAIIREPLVYWYLDAPTSLSNKVEQIESEALSSIILERFSKEFKLDKRLSGLIYSRRRAIYHYKLIFNLKNNLKRKQSGIGLVAKICISFFEKFYRKLQPMPEIVTLKL
jgi:glycosyltransferase involved in cell wall biosynthesis